MITGSTTGIYPLTTIQSFLARATIDPLTGRITPDVEFSMKLIKPLDDLIMAMKEKEIELKLSLNYCILFS